VQIKVAARHGHLNEEHQAQLAEKANVLLHYFERLTFIEVIVDLGGSKKKVEILADAEHKHDFVAHAESEDLMSAMVAAKDKIKQQIKHYKEKIQDHRRDPSHGGEDAIRP
jgi:putative sigma-54 modulation protein